MSHNYTKIRAELIAKGFTESVAFRVVDYLELEDIVSEKMHARECLDRERLDEAILLYYMKVYEMCERDLDRFGDDLEFLREQHYVEWARRKELAETGNCGTSIFLAAVLKYLGKFEDWQIVLITGVVYPPVSIAVDPLDELGLGV